MNDKERDVFIINELYAINRIITEKTIQLRVLRQNKYKILEKEKQYSSEMLASIEESLSYYIEALAMYSFVLTRSHSLIIGRRFVNISVSHSKIKIFLQGICGGRAEQVLFDMSQFEESNDLKPLSDIIAEMAGQSR